jgi:hypothetical protein
MIGVKRINTLVHTLLLLWTFQLSGIAYAESSVVEKSLPLQLGDYLSVEYIDLLRKTRSPMVAGKNSDSRQYIKIYFNVNKKVIGFSLMGNFHEGLGGIVTDPSLNVLREDFGETPAKLKVLSRSEFSVEVEGKTLVYRYVRNYKQFIARNTIAGKFKDGEGHLYTFTEDGLATFPTRSFQYEVAADFVTIIFDTFFEVIPHGNSTQYGIAGTQYGFKLINNKLQIFEMGGPMGNEPESKPFVTLTRIEEAVVKP